MIRKPRRKKTWKKRNYIISNAPFVVMSMKPKKKNFLMTSFAQFVASEKTCSSRLTNCQINKRSGFLNRFYFA